MTLEEKTQKFLDFLKFEFPLDYENILASLSQTYPTTFRINTLKYEPDHVLSLLEDDGFVVENADLENSYIVKSNRFEKPLSYSYLFEKQYVYIQSLSSMLPVSSLAPQKGEHILDLCAAPGSKTLQIASLTNNAASVVAVDNNKTRFYRLQALLNSYDARNISFICANGALLYKTHPAYQGYFDRVLLDAPCSNEGNITFTDMRTVNYWHPRLPKKLSKLQKSLLYSALMLLRPGGTMVYSTCTLNTLENEEVVNWALDKFKNLSLVESKRILPNGLYKGFYYAKLILI